MVTHSFVEASVGDSAYVLRYEMWVAPCVIGDEKYQKLSIAFLHVYRLIVRSGRVFCVDEVVYVGIASSITGYNYYSCVHRGRFNEGANYVIFIFVSIIRYIFQTKDGYGKGRYRERSAF